jgi:SAM-dependent methyltransferase
VGKGLRHALCDSGGLAQAPPTPSRPFRELPILTDALQIHRVTRQLPRNQMTSQLLAALHAASIASRQHIQLDSELTELKRILARGESGSTNVMRILGKLWARTYDNHMLTHEEAIRVLLNQLISLNRLRAGNYDNPLIGNRILEMTCGTGTVLKALHEQMPNLTAEKYRITANDISPDMKEIARQKLRGICREFTSEDIRDMHFRNRRFDTIIWSQTLHLVVDQILFAKEIDPQHPAEKTDHRQMKTQVIRDAFDLLPWGGYFVLIDEWPPKFTPTYSDPLETLVSSLFSLTFRPILELSTLRDDMMRDIEGARLVAECKARIDSEHSMFMLVYVKDRDDDGNSPALPRSEAAARAAGMDWKKIVELRAQAREKIIHGLAGLDAPFRSHLINMEGHDAFLPFNQGSTFNATGYDPNRIECTLSQKRGLDTIILPDVLHKLEVQRRETAIQNAINATRPGGSIVIMDEWPYSKGSNPDGTAIDPHGIHKRDVRRLLSVFGSQLNLEATIRQRVASGFDSGMYSFLCRRI